ncbi:hypothetical protein FQN57_005918 [Myotisia sp. PD_48]|nr:hypothetical protein FQN57_005918 [Myotisia sp. PD_48]
MDPHSSESLLQQHNGVSHPPSEIELELLETTQQTCSDKWNAPTSVNAVDIAYEAVPGNDLGRGAHYNGHPLFMLIGAFWYQVEYRACQLMPWLLMSRYSLPASETLLLDYVSEWNVISLFKSLKRKHYLVFLAIAGTLLINGLAIVSTRLFELESAKIEQPTPLQVTHHFDATGFNPFDVDTMPFVNAQSEKSNNRVPLPGKAGDLVFTPFQLNPQDRGHRSFEIEATVNVVSVELYCLDASVTSRPFEGEGWVGGPEWVPGITLTADGCSCEWESFLSISKDNAGRLQVTVCSCTGMAPVMPYDAGDYRVWGFIFEADPDGDLVPDSRYEKERYPENDRFRLYGAMCSIRYNATRGPMEISKTIDYVTSVDIDRQHHSSIQVFPGHDPSLILCAVFNIMPAFCGFYPSSISQASPLSNDTTWDQASFVDLFGRSMKPMVTNILHEYLLVPKTSTIYGVIRFQGYRLFVQQPSFYLIVFLTSALIIIALIFVFVFLPVSVCPRDPSSMAGLAVILAQSPDLLAELTGMGLKWPLEMESLLSGQLYRTTLLSNDYFGIRVEKVSPRSRMVPLDKEEQIRWWRPLPARAYMYIPTIAAPLVTIIFLGVLFQHQKPLYGITSLEGKSSLWSFTWAYIPALLMFLLRCMFQLLDFTARIFYPFHQLPKGNIPANTSMLENIHRKLPIYSTFDSLRKRQWALTASSLALMFAAWLPIAISGLFSVYDTNVAINTQLTQNARWFMDRVIESYNGTSKQEADEYLASMILHLNGSYPKWTYEELAFLPVSLPPPDANEKMNMNFTGAYVRARLPAWRLNLNCHESRPDSYSMTTNKYHIGVRFTKSESCGSREEQYPGPGYCSSLIILPKRSYETPPKPDYTTFPRRCVNLIYWAGESITSNYTKTLAVLECRPKMEEVDVDVQLQLPSYDFHPRFPPSVVPGSARTVHDIFFNGTRVPTAPLELERYLPENSMHSTNQIDSATKAIMSRYGVTIEELVSNTTKLIDSLALTYGIISAQMLNSYGHESLDSSTTQKTYPATLNKLNDHLFQDSTSTRILVCLLALMTVCGIISVFALNTKKVLPKNPCSIGALASLLVESRMVHDKEIIPIGAEWLNNKELSEKHILVNQRFRMGWWNRENNGNEPLEVGNKWFGIDVDSSTGA